MVIINQFNVEVCLPAVLGTTSALSYLNRRGKQEKEIKLKSKQKRTYIHK